MIMDNCGVESTTVSENTFSCVDTGTVNVLITATDPSGNVSMGTVEITVLDTISPTFTSCVNDIEVSVGEVVTYDIPQATDNCEVVSLIMTEGLESGMVFPEGETKVSYMATDPSGNISCCSFFVTVQMTTDTDEIDLAADLTFFQIQQEIYLQFNFPIVMLVFWDRNFGSLRSPDLGA